MERYFPPTCDALCVFPAQGLLNASTDPYPVDPVNPGFIMEPED